MCFVGPSAFFSFPAAGISSCSQLRGTQRARLDPLRKYGPLPRSAERALRVQSGKFAREGFRARRAIQARAIPRTKYINSLKKYPTSQVMSGILNVINVIRHYILGDGKVFPRNQQARHCLLYTSDAADE